jgi:hypothetical protein
MTEDFNMLLRKGKNSLFVKNKQSYAPWEKAIQKLEKENNIFWQESTEIFSSKHPVFFKVPHLQFMEEIPVPSPLQIKKMWQNIQKMV